MLLNQIIYQMICEGDSGISKANLISIVFNHDQLNFDLYSDVFFYNQYKKKNNLINSLKVDFFYALYFEIYIFFSGIAIQLSQVIRLLLDPENMALTANVS